MKKIILHIGFPKCASTTLQESVFFGLNSHKVNFLGRSRQLDKEANYILGNELMNKREGLNFKMPILKEGINVISDELLLIPNSIWNWRDRRNESNATFLKSEFEKIASNILILTVLRKQEDWIYSNYSFNYANLRKKGLYRNFDQVINELKIESKVFNEF